MLLVSIAVQVPKVIDFVHGNMLFQAIVPEGAGPGDTLYQAVPTVWRHRSEDGAVTINTMVGLSQVTQLEIDIR